MIVATSDGFADARFSAAREAFEANFVDGEELGASFCATIDGETAVDMWGGFADEAELRPWTRDTIVYVYSITKTMTALTVLWLADRGELDFAAPVARYWPEFAQAGKQGVLVRHVLDHTAGLPILTERARGPIPARCSTERSIAGRARSTASTWPTGRGPRPA